MEITLGRSAGFLYDWYAVDGGGSDPRLRDGILYLPGSGAGAPSLSPAFSGFWNDTSIADRVVGRIGAKYGTAYQDKALTTSTAMQRPVLFRQYVIPLAPLGGGPIHNAYSLNGLIAVTKVFFSNAAVTFFPMVLSRLVNQSGTLLYPNPTLGGITVPAAGGSLTITSSSGFAASDVGRFFYFNTLDNEVATAQSAPNYVASFTDASHVQIGIDYRAGSNVPGSGRTLTWLNDQVNSTLYGEWWDAANGYGAGSYPTSAAVHPYNIQIPGASFWPHLYLVLEFGGIVFNAGISRTYTLKFGDPSDVTLTTDPSNGSAGADFSYLNYSRTMSLNL